jgi:hypothetical protein
MSISIKTSLTTLTCLAILSFQTSGVATAAEGAVDGTVVKRILKATASGENLIESDAWRDYEQGFQREGDTIVCDNGPDSSGRRGAAQTVVLNQEKPEPIIASVFSRCEGVDGSPGADYSLYLDLVYADGSSLWGQTALFDCGTHDWQRREVVIMPAKPVRQVSFYMLLRGRAGKAWFRDARLEVVRASKGASLFDGVPVRCEGTRQVGFQVRDVAAGSDFVRIEKEALGLRLEQKSSEQYGVESIDVRLTDTTGGDRAVTLVYSVPVDADGLEWLENPRQAVNVEPGREYMDAGRFHLGANGRVSRYPFAAVAGEDGGTALGIDMAYPAVFRVGYNSGTGELFLAYDLGLTAEKPTARLRVCHLQFEPEWGFRAALSSYYQAFPKSFECLTPEQGLWMPFAKISEVEGWEDFGFKFKEGNNETGWDDEQGITTFRYTEPMTWWMRMATELPRTYEAALAETGRLAANGDKRALAFQSSAFEDASGQPVARLLDTPWCNGAVWSMNGMPGIRGEVTDFGLKWNAELREKLYGPDAKSQLDGEYIDSSEGYVTAELDFCRDHFAAAETPLTFSSGDHKPAIFRGLVAFEYIRAIADDVHQMDRLMMANSTPIRLCWLAPLLEVMGTETDWHRGGKWQPMSDAEMLYRRTMCKGKPYCFLMNSRFEEFSHELVERYMRRSLAYGMFPGFFSHNASEGHYFTRPELYNRDRPLFKKYVPLCKLVAEAGWEPVTLARSSDEKVYVERFGDRYLTVFNDSGEERTVTIEVEADLGGPSTTRELVGGGTVAWKGGRATMTLGAEDVAVVDLLR